MRARARRRQPSRAASGLPWREKRASCRDADRIGSAEREHLAAAIEYEADLHLRAAPARRDHPVQPEDLGADRRRDERAPAAGRRAALEVDHAAEEPDRHHPAEREVVAGANHGWEAHEGHRAWGWERDARPRGGGVDAAGACRAGCAERDQRSGCHHAGVAAVLGSDEGDGESHGRFEVCPRSAGFSRFFSNTRQIGGLGRWSGPGEDVCGGASTLWSPPQMPREHDSAAARRVPGAGFRHLEASIAQLSGEMAAGRLSSRRLTAAYLARIRALDEAGPRLRSVIELNPQALEIASACGPLHGMPILLKDNIATGDR